MKFSEIKVGMKVEDIWYNRNKKNKRINEDWGEGEVILVLKTKFKVNFSKKGIVTYDKNNASFIRKIKSDGEQNDF